MAIQLDDLVARLRLDSSGIGSGLSDLNGSLSRVGDKATQAGKKLTVGVTTPIVGLGVASVRLAADFDATMRQVAIATGGPADALSDLAKQLGAETAFSAKDAADAMLELAKSGLTPADIEAGALASTMKLAAAGGVELGNAATFVSNSMGAFGLEAKDADSIVTALAGAANASSASVESLGQGLSQSANAAKNAGLSLEETTAVLSLFDSVGIKGSDAGTSLKTMLTRLVPSTEKASKEMEHLGLNFVKADGSFVSIANVADQLQKKLGPLSEAQRSQALQTIFGSDAARAAAALTDAGAKKVVKFTKASKDQATTQKLANAAMEGTSGALERASGSIETAGLAVGQVLAPYVEKAAAKVEQLANAFVDADPGVQKLVVGGLAVAAALGPGLLLVGGLTKASGLLVRGLIGVGGAGTGAAARLATYNAAVASGTARTAAMSAALPKLGAAARGVAGAAGIGFLTSGLIEAKNEGANMSSVLKSAAGGAGIGAMFGPIGALVGAGAGAGLAALSGAFHQTADEAEAARIELLKRTGFSDAKKGADTLRDSLVGVANAYGATTRAAVKASFIGEDGKLQADIQKLRDLGVSMDTIVSATLGQAGAQQVVNAALDRRINREQAASDAAKANYDAATAAADQAIRDADGVAVATKGQLEAVQAAQDAQDDAREAYEATINPLAELTALQDTFGQRVKGNTREIVAAKRRQSELAGELGITLEQYKRFPKNVRTRVEDDGLPETSEGALRLIGQFKSLQNFRSIRTIIEATDAPLTLDQIDKLQKRYGLTPKQVRTLIQAVGVESETGKVRNYKGELDKIPPKTTTTIETRYTYSGRKSPTGQSGGKVDVNPRTVVGGDDRKNSDQLDYYGEELGSDFSRAIGRGMVAEAAKTEKKAKDTGDKIKKKFELIVPELEALGSLLSSSFADGLVSNPAQIERGFSRLSRLLGTLGNAEASKIASRARKSLALLGQQYAELGRQLAVAQGNLEAFEAARERVVARQAALSAAGGDLTGLDLSKILSVGEDVSAQAIITALTDVEKTAVGFDDTLNRLAAAGLSQDALDQLIAKGPEAAAATAQAILAGGPEAIARINALQASIATTGLAIQSKASQTMYDAGVAAQQGLITGLESQMGALEEQMNRIAQAMVRALRKALKIKSPSKVTDQIGVFTGLGLVDGLDSTRAAVARAGAGLAGAAVMRPPAFLQPGAVSLAAARAASAVAGAAQPPQIRVFIGDKELTDMVRVELADAVSPVGTAARMGA